MNTALQTRYYALKQTIDNAAEAAGRPVHSVELLAVTKGRSVEMIRQLYALGQRDFGENKLQEAVVKIAALQDCPDIIWHFIGRIQRNKVRQIAAHFDWVDSVGNQSILWALSRARDESMRPLHVCLQLTDERQNHGLSTEQYGFSQAQIFKLVQEIGAMPHLSWRGVMVMASQAYDASQRALIYQQCDEQFKALKRLHPGLDTLSMGTSLDYTLAVQQGATLVRIGRDLFE